MQISNSNNKQDMHQEMSSSKDLMKSQIISKERSNGQISIAQIKNLIL